MRLRMQESKCEDVWSFSLLLTFRSLKKLNIFVNCMLGAITLNDEKIINCIVEVKLSILGWMLWQRQ